MILNKRRWHVPSGIWKKIFDAVFTDMFYSAEYEVICWRYWQRLKFSLNLSLSLSFNCFLIKIDLCLIYLKLLRFNFLEMFVKLFVMDLDGYVIQPFNTTCEREICF